jgi:hypothetical protein
MLPCSHTSRIAYGIFNFSKNHVGLYRGITHHEGTGSAQFWYQVIELSIISASLCILGYNRNKISNDVGQNR